MVAIVSTTTKKFIFMNVKALHGCINRHSEEMCASVIIYSPFHLHTRNSFPFIATTSAVLSGSIYQNVRLLELEISRMIIASNYHK